MNLRRLKLLEKAVREQPDELFIMWVWGRKTYCGTAACAAGSFALHYPKQGLKLRRLVAYSTVLDLYGPDGTEGIDACEVVFGMTTKQADRLFDPISYKSSEKPNVLRRIRSYIRKAERERAGGRKADKR